MTQQYAARLTEYGLTESQYRRAVAAHELAHGIIAAASQSLDVKYVKLTEDPRNGVHGAACIGPARGHRAPDPVEHAVESLAGAIAKTLWLQREERVWSPDLAYLVHATAAGDRDTQARLNLNTPQEARAQRAAEHAVTHHWQAIRSGVPQLVRRGRLDRRALRKLARS